MVAHKDIKNTNGPGMPLSHIEHYLVLSDESTRRATGTATCSHAGGWHPDFGFPVYGCTSRAGCVHIGKSAKHASDNQKPTSAPRAGCRRGTGAIDHIAFRAKGLRETMTHLRRHKIQFSERRANGRPLSAVHGHPNGIKSS